MNFNKIDFIFEIILIIIIFIILVGASLGCGNYKSLTNQEIIDQTNFCIEHDMYPFVCSSKWSHKVKFIRCISIWDAKALIKEEAYDKFIKILKRKKK